MTKRAKEDAQKNLGKGGKMQRKGLTPKQKEITSSFTSSYT